VAKRSDLNINNIIKIYLKILKKKIVIYL
jgi:hypothetical protein